MALTVTSPQRVPRSAWTIRIVSAFVVVASISTAVGFGLRWWPESLSTRHRTPASVLEPEQLAAYHAFAATTPAAAPLIISYHDIAPAGGDNTSVYTVTPERLDEQMAMLAAAGFTSITQRQMADFLNGAAVPARSVLITFDDGAKGIWKYADRILERYGFHATAFVITGSVGTRQPYYLTWAEMRHMRDNGRWDFAGHTDEGHGRVPLDATGTTVAPFLLTRRWLAEPGRLETLDEWRVRVQTDLARSVDQLVDHGFDAPLLFAHPFAAVTGPANDPAIPIELDRIVEEIFEASVANDPRADTIGPSEIAQRHLLRVAVRGDTTTPQLFERLRVASDA